MTEKSSRVCYRWPESLEEAESLRDTKRQQIQALFSRVQAMQLELKEMEKELIDLDDYIDDLEEEEQQLQQQQQQQRSVSPVEDSAVTRSDHVLTTQTQTQSEILTDPRTQLTPLSQSEAQLQLRNQTWMQRNNLSLRDGINDDDNNDRNNNPLTTMTTTANGRPRMISTSAVKPPPLVLSEDDSRKKKQTIAKETFSSSTPTSTSATSLSTSLSRQSSVLPLRKATVENLLRDAFRLSSFRHSQEEIINATLDQRDVFVVMRTGGGKSLTYQLPALLERAQAKVTLVVSPLLSLIQDQESQFNHIAPGAATSFTSGLGTTEHSRRWDMVRDRNAGVCLILVTPEKVTKSPKLRNELQKLHDQKRLSRFVIDEAHCASQWGISFRPDYAQLGILKRHFPSVPVLAVTATASERVRQDVCNILGIAGPATQVFRSTANRPNLRYAVYPKPASATAIIAELASYIQTNHTTNSGIIYTLSRKDADTVAQSLCDDYGIPAAAYHSDVTPVQKERIQQQWMENIIQVVVATIAFGLGINKPDVRFVLHHCISKNLDSYYQESGRAGRDGEAADCVLYYSPKDVSRLRSMAEDTPGGADQLKPMIQYAQAFGNDTVCRAILLNSLGEPNAPSPMQVLSEQGDETTQTREVGKHCQVVTRLIHEAWQSNEPTTISKVVASWRAKRDVPDFVEQYPPNDLTTMECEIIVVSLIVADVLAFHVHWTAYQAVSYVKLGAKGMKMLQSPDPRISVRFPITRAKSPAATTSVKKSRANAVNTSSSEWISADSRKKTSKAKKAAAPAKRKTVTKKTKSTAKKARKVPTKKTAAKKKAGKRDVPLAHFLKPKEKNTSKTIELSSDEEIEIVDEQPRATRRKAVKKQDEDLWDDHDTESSDGDDEYEFTG